ncbi:hypothetical protein GN244_ATG18968 [Phytophthora infestans]|uniref:Uncharacterized protein n=1 Tax=Phytophthora infestans TaxID=4787 RepID=A0A833VUI3_PHYIN|nr:hypothetical protein GN244_ATG18968 [Phytophthora infestans]
MMTSVQRQRFLVSPDFDEFAHAWSGNAVFEIPLLIPEMLQNNFLRTPTSPTELPVQHQG